MLIFKSEKEQEMWVGLVRVLLKEYGPSHSMKEADRIIEGLRERTKGEHLVSSEQTRETHHTQSKLGRDACNPRTDIKE